MGYTTEFSGKFKLDRPLTAEQAEYLKKFSDTRRMKRDASKTELFDDPIRKAVGLPVGQDGGYYVGASGYSGQDSSDDILNYNNPPDGQPGLWCQWVPNETRDAIEWDGGEKFYYYVEWLQYLIDHFLTPWGCKLNGSVEWRGEEWNDTGFILVVNSVIAVEERGNV